MDNMQTEQREHSNHSQWDCYDNGYNEGYSDGEKDGQKQGYKEGFAQGFLLGHKAGLLGADHEDAGEDGSIAAAQP